MTYPTDAATDAAILAGKIKACSLVDLYLKTAADAPLILRGWTWPGTANYPGTVDYDGSTSNNAYTSLFGRITINWAIRMAASLSPEPLVIQLDGSRSGDNADWVGQFVDAKWHQARVRVRQVMMNWDTEVLAAQPMREWHGLLDHRELVQQVDQPATWDVTCQGGLFRVRGRRLKTRSHADQQLRAPGDMFYLGTANMVGRPLNWAKKPGNIPGTSTGGATGTGGGGGSMGGGKQGLDIYN